MGPLAAKDGDYFNDVTTKSNRVLIKRALHILKFSDDALVIVKR